MEVLRAVREDPEQATSSFAVVFTGIAAWLRCESKITDFI